MNKKFISEFEFKKSQIKKIEDEAYWKGFEEGQKNSLKHNILLMKMQLKTQRKFTQKTGD